MTERWRFQQGRTEKRCPSNARNAFKANRVVRPTVERLQLGFPQWWWKVVVEGGGSGSSCLRPHIRQRTAFVVHIRIYDVK